MDSTNFFHSRVTLAAILLVLSGCSMMPHESPLPHDGPTMGQIYKDHNARGAATDSEAQAARSRMPLRAADEFDPGPTRESAQAQIERRFARVSNPDLVMTVFPHLAKGKYPVPGYQTMFPMYESVEYLLPGEVAGNLDGHR